MKMKTILAVICALSMYMVVAKVCPGGGQTCESRMTCCELPSGQQGCCPYDNATCCPDKVHCCPNGYDCLSDRCQKHGGEELMALRKLMIDVEEPKNDVVEGYRFANESDVQCPDRQTVCPDLNTCCLVSPTQYGCCPLENAVCCRNMAACCPYGMVCSGNTCEGVDKVNEVEIVKQSTVNTKQTPINTICPGGSQTCPAGDTCCPRSYGQYGCCPLLAATCCNDGLHCCPHGYRCDGRGYCLKQN